MTRNAARATGAYPAAMRLLLRLAAGLALIAVPARATAVPASSGRLGHHLGRSSLGRPIDALELRGRGARVVVLVIGCIHGDERMGERVVAALARRPLQDGVDLWLVRSLNPDGEALHTRLNGRGVDLNRNFPAEWRLSGSPGDPEYSGPRPFSEPETRIARALILRLHPDVTIWFHQPQAIIRAWGRSIPLARRYARLAGAVFRPLRWLRGTAPNWQNHRQRGTTSFVAELPGGPLSGRDARRYAIAVRRLARSIRR